MMRPKRGERKTGAEDYSCGAESSSNNNNGASVSHGRMDGILHPTIDTAEAIFNVLDSGEPVPVTAISEPDGSAHVMDTDALAASHGYFDVGWIS